MLTLAPRPVPLTSHQNPSALFCRQQHARFSASTTIDLKPTTRLCDAGLVSFQNETHYFFIGVRITGGAAREVLLEQTAGGTSENPLTTILATAPLPPQSTQVELKIDADGRPHSFLYRTGGGDFLPLKEDVDGSILSTDVAGGFQGVMLGMYARSP